MASELPNRGARDLSGSRARGLSARTLLTAAVAIPLLGLAATLWPSIDQARDVSADAAALEEAASNVETLTQLDGALLDEMSFTIIDSLIETLGIPPELTESAFGTGPEATTAGAIAATDSILANGRLDSIERRLADIRSQSAGLAESQAAYGAVRDDVRTALDGWISDLGALPLVSSPELVEQIELLTVGIELRTGIADAYYAYFSVLFALRDEPETEFARLIEARERIARSVAQLEEAVAADPEGLTPIGDLLDDPSIPLFVSVVDDLIADGTTVGVAERGVELSLMSALTNDAAFEGLITGRTNSAAATLIAVDFQAATVVATAEVIRVDADHARTNAYLLAGGLLLVSLLGIVAISRFITTPLRRLETEVGRLSAGETLDVDRPNRGPREVTGATIALRRASTHFSLVTEQARQLAAGELDAEVLDERAEGGLGDSLQVAVDRLRDAMADQNEFRRRLTHEATHDGLTQIPNRNASMAQLTRALARARRADDYRLSVLFIDLDNFKDINDYHGHHAGDIVLTQVAQRLVNGAREGDFVGRLGGDEFIVIAESIDDISYAVHLAERLLHEVSDPIAMLEGEVHVRASVGIAVAEAVHRTAEELLRDADLAVYRAKAGGRGGVEICDEDLRNQFVQDTDLTIALQRAVDDGEFVMHYQPIVDGTTHTIRSFEALVRWRRSDTGELVPPGLFIEFAERSLLIVDIDRWVVDAVARQLAAWQHDERFAGVPVSVNISGRHLTHPQMVDHVLKPLEHHGVDPALLIVEITESALVNDLASASVALAHLRDAGVRVAIDDFGTGYTSLAHLRALPVDILKIDRSFTTGAITDPGEASIVKLIIDAGHLLGATVTAEGIETATEARRLVELGTDNLQGYYFAKPGPADQLLGIDLVSSATPVTD
jgi:diguanylate cyclase (GGDEF)-like protein